MLVALLVLIVVIGVLAGVLLDLAWVRGRSTDVVTAELVDVVAADPADWLDGVTAQRVTIHLVGDQTLEGLLVDVCADGLVLRAAQLVLDAKHDMAGDVFVPRSKVLMVQRHPAVD